MGQNLLQPYPQTGSLYPLFSDLEDKVVLVTGGAGGIGAEATYAFAAQGARVFFVDINAEQAGFVIEKCAKEKHSPQFIQADLSDIGLLEQLVENVLAQSGKVIDILVNNAANDKRIDFDNCDFYREYLRSRTLNSDSPVMLTRAVLQKGMIPRHEGCIITVSSVHSQMASDPNMLPYGMAKSAINHFSEWVAHTQGHNGIRSNIIEPGWIATEKQMASIMTPDAVQACLDDQTVKRIGHCSDIVNAMLYLASKSSGFMNGQTIRIDGGTIGNYNTVHVSPENIGDLLTRQCLGIE